MDDELKRILKLLEEGKIKADEAEKLIEALEERKESKRKDKFGFVNIGEIVTDALTSAFSIIPGVIVNSMKGIKHVDEEYEWSEDKPLFLEITAGDLGIDVWQEEKIRIKGEGVFILEDNLIKFSAGDFSLNLPKLNTVKMKVSAGDVKGKLVAKESEILIKMGDGDLYIESEKFRAEVNMGDLDIVFAKAPSQGELICNTGDMSIVLPDDFDGKLVVKVTMGEASVERRPDMIVKGDTYIYGNGEKSEIIIRCSMGNINIK
uniref:Uncharacterized protein n=1 Tax=Dictyoglomus thermophilum TaxID=14 RepID=A0A7C3ML81_DICTH